MPQQLYSTEECQQRSTVAPDFGPGDFVESCWRELYAPITSPHRVRLMQVRRVYRTRNGSYAFSGTGEYFAGYFRKVNQPNHTKTNHRIGVPKNKLP